MPVERTSIVLRLVLLAVAAGQERDLLAQSPPPVLAAWVALSPTGPVVRAVTEAVAYPRTAVLETPTVMAPRWGTAMSVRAAPSPPDFANLVCEWQPPPSARYVALEGHASALRMPAPNPRRIVVLGDTGCLGGRDQDCERDWYFPDLIRFAAARHPDLVIHVGDYTGIGKPPPGADLAGALRPRAPLPVGHLRGARLAAGAAHRYRRG